eukprot:245719-Hanusia_phi.AAC.3
MAHPLEVALLAQLFEQPPQARGQPTGSCSEEGVGSREIAAAEEGDVGEPGVDGPELLEEGRVVGSGSVEEGNAEVKVADGKGERELVVPGEPVEEELLDGDGEVLARRGRQKFDDLGGHHVPIAGAHELQRLADVILHEGAAQERKEQAGQTPLVGEEGDGGDAAAAQDGAEGVEGGDAGAEAVKRDRKDLRHARDTERVPCPSARLQVGDKKLNLLPALLVEDDEPARGQYRQRRLLLLLLRILRPPVDILQLLARAQPVHLVLSSRSHLLAVHVHLEVEKEAPSLVKPHKLDHGGGGRGARRRGSGIGVRVPIAVVQPPVDAVEEEALRNSSFAQKKIRALKTTAEASKRRPPLFAIGRGGKSFQFVQLYLPSRALEQREELLAYEHGVSCRHGVGDQGHVETFFRLSLQQHEGDQQHGRITLPGTGDEAAGGGKSKRLKFLLPFALDCSSRPIRNVLLYLRLTG